MSTDRKLEEVINKLNQLTNDFNKYKSTVDDIIIMNTTLVQEIANQINTKIDILCNLENNAKPVKGSAKSKSLSKTSFFKDKMKNNINAFLNELYTQEELDELYTNAEVKSKKTEIQQKNKIIDLLYNNITKIDENKHNILKKLFDNYKQSMDSSEEETKSEE